MIQRWGIALAAATTITALAGCSATVVKAGPTTSSSSPSSSLINVPQTSKLALRSAIVVAATSPQTLSCRGGAFCRENVIAPGHEDAADDATSDCARRGGELSTSACSRNDAVALCEVAGGEAGPITVLTYGQSSAKDQRDAIETMSDLCDKFDGTMVKFVKPSMAFAKEGYTVDQSLTLNR